GVWTIYVKDFLGVDDGYIFEWGLELDESLMPGQWDYTAEIVDYDWTGAGVVEAHPTGAETSVTPPSYGNNIYTLTVTDEYGCSTDQDVTVTLLQCDGVWTGDVSTDWFTDANWGRGFVPDGSCEGGFGRNVTIPDVSSTSGNFPVIAGVANCDDFTVDAGANVKIAPGGALTVCGTMTNNGGNAGVVLLSDATGDGSLIHSNTGVVGTVQKYIPGTRYHYIGSPVIAATTTGIGVNTTQFYKWDATMHWNGMGGDPYGTPSTIDYAPWGTTYSGNLDNGTGYAYYHETQTLQFVGEINVGDYNLTLFDESGNTVDPNQGWNLISNPYASAIDWDLVVSAGWDNDVEGAIYMFDDDGSGYQTNYRYYIPGAVGSINYGIGTQDATQSIPVGQGFFVKAAKDNKPLALKAADRAHASQAFYKNNRSYNNLMRLNVSTQNYSDELVVRLLEDATFEYDGLLDARKLIPTNPLIPQIFAISDQGNNMAITSLPMYTDTSNVMLCVVAMPGNLTISASEFTFEPDRKVFLHDKQEEVFVSLMEDEQYNFFFEGGLNSTRFELLFTANQAPYINIQVDNISTLEDYSFDYTLNQSTFIDPDGDFELSASLMGGLELPQWLNFDPINNVFWGQPDNSDVGVYYVQVTATDEFGASVSETFSIEVINTNDEPFLNIPIPDFDVYMNEPIVIKLPANTFIDVDVNDRFAYSATFNNDMLPTWLHFDENNLLFSGIPINISPEDYEIQLTATDVAGAKAHDVFLISVKGVTGLNDFGNVLSVHPNPSIGLFTMSVSDISYVDYDVYIFDATGKLIYSAQANSDNYEIDLTGVASGVYSIRVVFDNQTFNKKLIIK
ncbi:MAG: T9SS type A sorting domain-containing protein, partial [Bacteroidales bacterium]|nr:T9SS type A sorting domain-containing protein [Bacteroidales bacterium]